MSRRTFIAYVVADTLSTVGTRVSGIAIPWLVLTTTGSAMLTGAVAMAELLPYVLAQALSGPLIDRIGARRIAIAGDIGSALVLAIVPLMALSGWLPFELLLPVVVVLGVLRGPSNAAKQAMVPDIAAAAGLPLERVTGTAGMIERLSTALGALAAGGIIALIGAAPALLVNAATFLASALIVARWLRFAAVPKVEAEDASGYLPQLREGFDFVRRDAVLMGISIMVAITNLFDQAFATVMLPVWVLDRALGPETLGLLFGTLAAASIGGAAIATAFGERIPRLLIYTVAFMIAGLPRFAVFALDAPLLAVLAVMAIAGFASGFLNPILGAVILERIPRPLLGRVSALSNAMSWSLLPFGGLFGGALIGLWGLDTAFWLSGFGYLLATLLPLVRPSFRSFDKRITADRT